LPAIDRLRGPSLVGWLYKGGACIVLNNREWATLIWAAGIFLPLIVRKEIHSSVRGILRTLLNPQLLTPLLVMVGYVVG